MNSKNKTLIEKKLIYISSIMRSLQINIEEWKKKWYDIDFTQESIHYKWLKKRKNGRWVTIFYVISEIHNLIKLYEKQKNYLIYGFTFIKENDINYFINELNISIEIFFKSFFLDSYDKKNLNELINIIMITRDIVYEFIDYIHDIKQKLKIYIK